MEHEQSRENYVEPAIILTGDFLRDATDERRLQIAASLAELLGGNAIVQEVDSANLSALAETAVPAPESVDGTANASAVDEASTEGLRFDAEYPPFTLLIQDSYSSRPHPLVSKLRTQAPETVGDGRIISMALRRVLLCAAHDRKAAPLFTHYREDAPDDDGLTRTYAITFKHPRHIVEQPELLYDVEKMGTRAAKALGEFVKLVTTPVDLTAGQ